MKTFKTLLEEISTQEEEELSLEDTDLISDVVEKIKEIVDGASESNANEIVHDLEAAIAPFNLTFDKEEAPSLNSNIKLCYRALAEFKEENPSLQAMILISYFFMPTKLIFFISIA